jgi:hypothetical protein
MREVDPIVQRYRARFAPFDRSAIDPPRQPGNPGHPKSAYGTDRSREASCLITYKYSIHLMSI